MPQLSAGLLMYRIRQGKPGVLLVHPGGPFWRNKDEGAWTIPKGEVAAGEELLDAARREFREETGFTAAGEFIALNPVKQKAGKVVHAWAVEGDIDTAAIESNTFTMEWPPRSGKRVEFPEVDRAEFFDLATARKKMNPAQAAFLDELEQLLSRERGTR
ncbi:MAG: Phosphohydrolase [Phycisphaerales bacterium]|nr:Phosphohydrolase [Phycisphaerales bacterium]